MTWREALRCGGEKLARAGIENPRTDAWLLMEFSCGIDKNKYYLCAGEEMPETALERYREIVSKRSGRIPLQHLTGEQAFMGFVFRVTPDVLIPRQDTETLAETVLEYLREGGAAESEPGRFLKNERSKAGAGAGEGNIPCRVLDLCTGSGCIAVSIKKLFERASVTGSDVSSAALAVAAENAALNGADVTFLRSDLFEEISGRFDVIVSNPPYIPSGQIDALMPEVRDFEPRSALDGRADGLDFYRKITEQSPDYLSPGGALFFEIGFDQGEAVSMLMKKNGFKEIRIRKDLAGMDRVVSGVRKSASEP